MLGSAAWALATLLSTAARTVRRTGFRFVVLRI